MKALSVTLVALLLCACSSAPKKEAAAEADEAIPIIDAHVHTRFSATEERTSKIVDTEERFLAELKAVGGVGAVSHTRDNGFGYQEGLRQKTKVAFCVGVNPKPNLKFIEDGLKAGRFSCMKIYLGYEHQFAYDPRYRPVYRLAEKYDVPVVFHTGDTYSTKAKLKYADPLTIDEVAVDFPKVKFVIAHLGNPWVESAAEVIYKNPNVYGDVSAFLLGNMDKIDRAHVDELVVKPIAWGFRFIEDPSKLMFGTDWPLAEIAPYLAAVKRAIPREHWRAVFHDNAARVFKLK